MSQTTHDLLTAHARTVDLTETERHRLLEVDRRRHALAALADRTQPLTLDEVAAAVADRQGDVDEEDPEAVSEVATTLHHIHLPKMAEAGVVGYDPSTKQVTP